MIAHACYECARHVLFFSDIIFSWHYLESLALSMASALRKVSVLGNSSLTCHVSSLIRKGTSLE